MDYHGTVTHSVKVMPKARVTPVVPLSRESTNGVKTNVAPHLRIRVTIRFKAKYTLIGSCWVRVRVRVRRSLRV